MVEPNCYITRQRRRKWVENKTGARLNFAPLRHRRQQILTDIEHPIDQATEQAVSTAIRNTRLDIYGQLIAKLNTNKAISQYRVGVYKTVQNNTGQGKSLRNSEGKDIAIPEAVSTNFAFLGSRH